MVAGPLSHGITCNNAVFKHIDQVALGIVLMRYQRNLQRHFHWEQPRNSHMFKLPYMQEIRQKLLALDVDLCTAGDLKDPDTQLHMRKSLTIMTSSRGLYQDLEGLKCQGQHQHQQVSGSCQVNGSSMLRTTFTEHYPRKFARRLAKSLCRLRIPQEKPYLLQEEETFGPGPLPTNPTVVRDCPSVQSSVLKQN